MYIKRYQGANTVKRYMVIWGLFLIAAGFLLFRLVMLNIYPESMAYMRAGNPRQFWDGLSVAQKFSITAMEIPVFAGVVLVLVGLVRLATRKRAVE
jgi:uncharacterized membrane protein